MVKRKQKKENKQKGGEKNVLTQVLKTCEEVKKNWKALVGVVVIFLVFSMKMNEEWSSEAYGKQSDVNLYSVLNVSSSAPVEDIKKQYKKLLIENHPDKNPDCKDCEERMGKIQKAYEVLVNEESRNHYDQTNGIMEPINSTTPSIYSYNFRKMVLNSNRPWIVQVYSETSSNCQTFAGFWEEYAKEYNYLNFGRINFNSQKSLINGLPYAVDELPTVISYVTGRDNEIFEFYDDRSPNSFFRSFVKKTVGVHFETKKVNEFEEMYKGANKSGKPGVVFVSKNTTPTYFHYLAFYFKNQLNTYQTKPNEKIKVQGVVDNDKVTAVVIPSDKVRTASRVFTNGHKKNELNAVLRYTHFLTVPGKLTRTL